MGLGQNGVVLALFEPKGRRFGSAFFFLEFYLYQDDVILDKTGPKRRRFEEAFTYSKRRRLG